MPQQINLGHSDPKTSQDLIDALHGALAEGVDLGSRESQIRLIGASLEASLSRLRSTLSELDIDLVDSEIALYLDIISLTSKFALNYKS